MKRKIELGYIDQITLEFKCKQNRKGFIYE